MMFSCLGMDYLLSRRHHQHETPPTHRLVHQLIRHLHDGAGSIPICSTTLACGISLDLLILLLCQLLGSLGMSYGPLPRKYKQIQSKIYVTSYINLPLHFSNVNCLSIFYRFFCLMLPDTWFDHQGKLSWALH